MSDTPRLPIVHHIQGDRTDLEVIEIVLERAGVEYDRGEPGTARAKDIELHVDDHAKVEGYSGFFAVLAFDPVTEALLGVEVWE